MQSAGGVTTGFDYLRIGLSLAVLAWHSITIATGSFELDRALWSGQYRFLPAAIVPTFFALSGFLVAGSLGRTRLHQFVTLRVIRLVPALAVEITLSALLFGLAFTTLPRSEYFSSPDFLSYFLNIVGDIHFELPGVFAGNPIPRIVNGQLWTIPFELECYLALILLSASTLVKRRRLFLWLIAAAAAAITIRAFAGHPVTPFEHPPGRMMVMCFLASVGLYLFSDVVPYSNSLGVLSAMLSAVLLQIPNTAYLAAFPIAYMTVWLGLMRLPRIPFGDLSYGVYLFHYPIQQSIVHLLPGVKAWWLLTLISVPLTGLCAWLSWTLIEGPVLVHKRSIVGFVDRGWVALEGLGRRILAKPGGLGQELSEPVRSE